jgi:hypothetical protein
MFRSFAVGLGIAAELTGPAPALTFTVQYGHWQTGLPARKKLDDALRRHSSPRPHPLRADTKTLRKAVRCPGAGPRLT